MKKLIILAVSAVAAVTANATCIKWSANAVYKSGSTSALMSGATAYLFDAATRSQDSLLTALRGTGAATALADALETGTLGTDGKLAAIDNIATDVYTGGSKVNFYTVVIGDGEVFITTSSSKTIAGTGSTSYSALTGNSKNAAFDSKTSFNAAGWYKTASVPEPTSGMLLLIGMASLALRRRRA